MSRPGFVFDLTTDPSDTTAVDYRCRSCGKAEHGTAVGTPLLHIRMKAHLTAQHGLTGSDDWKITHQERNATQAMVCFWPPEAL